MVAPAEQTGVHPALDGRCVRLASACVCFARGFEGAPGAVGKSISGVHTTKPALPDVRSRHSAMKQRIHNQKLLNWHKPLQAGDWKSAFLRRRAAVPRGGRDWLGEVGEPRERCIYCGDLECLDHRLSPLRCMWNEPNRKDYYTVGEDEDGLDIYETPQQSILSPSERSVFGRLAFSNQLPLPMALVDHARLEVLHGGERISEEALADFFKELTQPDWGAQNSGDLGSLELEHVRRVLPSVRRARGGMRLEKQDYLTRLMALFSGYRTRALSMWRKGSESPREEIARLARHLFCEYPVPEWLGAVWGASKSVEIGTVERSLKWACWFVCLGRGGSLRKLCRLMGIRLTDGAVAHLQDAPAHLMPELACMWAEAVAITGKRRVADWIIKHEGYYIDPTLVPRRKKDVQFSRFWLQTMQWFGQHEGELTDEQAAELLEWGWFKFDHSQREGGRLFTWSGRTPRRCLRQAPAFLEDALRALGGATNHRWEAVGVSWEVSEKGSEEAMEVWRFEELVQSSELWEEGVAMRHCVAKYDHQCNKGWTVIVSVRRNGARALTIELQGQALRLGQVKGRFNRQATAEESEVVQRWVREVVRSRARR